MKQTKLILLGILITWGFLGLPAFAASFWNSTATPALLDDGDTSAVELGLQFTSDVPGSVIGIKFYKGPNNKGTHVGNLWSGTGAKLASVTFTNETASGWQQANFATPVNIQANTPYVISYFAPVGRYSTNVSFFATTRLDVTPLHAAAVKNGLYAYGSSSRFPTQTWNATNYWVDVIFQPNATTGPAGTSTAITSSLNPSTVGQAVTFTAKVTAASGAPTGSVQFLDGGAVLGTSTLTSGAASLTINKLTAGSHAITAKYSGDSNFSGSASPTLTQTVNSPISTTTALSSSPNPSTAGQTVTLKATVTAASGSPTGSVQFLDGSAVLGTATLGAGQASLAVSSLSAGTHSLTARYSGNSTYSGSASSVLTQTVNAAALATTTTLVSSLNPAAIGQSVTFTATVSASSGTPTGSVQFLDGSTLLGTGTLASGRTSITISSLSSGAHSIAAKYSGDSSYAGSVSSVITETVTSGTTTTTASFWNSTATPALLDDTDTSSVELGIQFTSDVPGSVIGVKFYKGPTNTGTHLGNLWSSSGVKLASVTFTNETASGWQQANFATPVNIQANTPYVISYHAPVGKYSANLNFFASASLDVPPLHAAAVKNGLYAYGASSSFPTQTWYGTNYWVDVIFQPNAAVGVAGTSTALTSSLNPSTVGQAVTFTARVTAASGAPTGSIQFLDGGAVLATSTLASGAASFTTNALSAGSHAITAKYSGDSNFSGSASPILTQTVNSAISTTTALTSSPNPSTAGQTVTLKATVTAASGAPTGSVQFLDGSAVLGTATLGAGQASLAVSSLSAGTHSLTARYSGGSTYSGSASSVLTQTVTSGALATTTTLASSLNPATIGQSVTFTATVSASSGTPTGSVQFLDGSTVLGTGTLGSGRASVTISSLSPGAHSITAKYSGDSSYAASVSSAVSEIINHAVSLSWAASTSTNAAGYNIYRASTSGGPYTKLNAGIVPGTSYTDTAVQAGQTYYYVCTTVDTGNNESGYSNQAQAVVPTP